MELARAPVDRKDSQTNSILCLDCHQRIKKNAESPGDSKNQDCARLILERDTTYYNYIRPHMSFKGKTPALRAGIEIKVWKQLIENATQNETLQLWTNPEGSAIEALQLARKE